MIITDRFVMVNYPKTGSTFARHALNELYYKRLYSGVNELLIKFGLKKRPLYKSLMLPCTEYPGSTQIDETDQHGRIEQIPEEYKDKPVVSIVRSPYKRCISDYEFTWWKENPIDDWELIKEKFPNFPNLNLEEYLNYKDFEKQYRMPGIKYKEEIGPHTVEFVQFYFKNPREALERMDENYISSGLYKNDMHEVTFLRTEKLNEDLYDYLLRLGYPKNKIEFILERKKVRPHNTQRKSENDRKKYFSADLLDSFKYKERYLFKILDDFGFKYG